MLLKRNLLESVTIVSCSGTVLCLLLHYFTNISPITGVYLFTYLIATFLVSLFFSFKFVQYLLHLNKPIKYDMEWLEGYPEVLRSLLPRAPKRSIIECTKEYDTNELSVISTVLERKLVSSWYVPYISQEIGFPFACKQMLDQMIGKTFQICNKIETKDVYIDLCSILVTHLKEYRKALRRHEKAPNENIENLYKKSHPVFNTDNKTVDTTDHCTNIIRIILKELISWELWDTPHSELLVRILSKKLDSFIDNTLANPQWLNDRLITILNGKPMEIPKEEEKGFIVKDEVKEETQASEAKSETTIESALSTVITKGTAPILHRAINEDYNEEQTRMQDTVEEVPVTSSGPVDIKSSPVLRQRRGRQGRNEVKIYDRIIEGSVKTWETDLDLQCISLGQDLLASLDGELTLSRLWGADAEPEGSPNPPRNKSPQPLWFGEDDVMDLELETSPPKTSPVRKEHSPKPAEILKDIQTTVHQAKTKIGDLQVSNANIDVRKRSGDEAAGVMEGLLDFGIAGLKKGLRFTGLSDDSQEKSPSHHKSERASPASESKAKEQKDIGNSTTVVQKEDNGTPTTAPPLLKQQRVISQDSLPSQAKPILKGDVPPLSSLIPLSDSPEPEYEEAADLSTSIAKLRCLLSQRDTQRPEVWWAGEEARSRSHDRPVDTATLADEFDTLSLDRGSPGQTAKSDGIQRLDKLFHRTMTGVFNSIKTAVGGEGGDGGEATRQYDWTYVCTSVEASVGGAVARLVGSRRAYSHVDAALDSLSLAAPPAKKPDEVVPDDFEEWVWSHNRSWSGAGEVAGAAGLLRSHVAVRLATVLCADLAEQLINSWLEDLGPWLRSQVFQSFRSMEQEPAVEAPPLRELALDETVSAVVQRLPVTFVFGEETLTSTVRFTLSSFSHAAVNKDVSLRLLDVLSTHFKMSAANRNPSFDAN